MLSAIVLAAAVQLDLGATNFSIDAPLTRPADAVLVWSDEFAGKSLDPHSWSYDTAHNKGGWFNHELQYYSANRPANLRVENGILTIEARRETLDRARFPDWGGQGYTSARILSKQAWTYGFFEIRARLPCARGTWPAIWMLPIKMKKWPDDGKIDHHGADRLRAQPGACDASHGLVQPRPQHPARRAEADCDELLGVPSLSARLAPPINTVGIDDRAILFVPNDQPGNRGAWPFDTPFRLILNLAIGGDWAGAKGVDDQALPQRLDVDYVRVWRTSLPVRASVARKP